MMSPYLCIHFSILIFHYFYAAHPFTWSFIFHSFSQHSPLFWMAVFACVRFFFCLLFPLFCSSSNTSISATYFGEKNNLHISLPGLVHNKSFPILLALDPVCVAPNNNNNNNALTDMKNRNKFQNSHYRFSSASLCVFICSEKQWQSARQAGRWTTAYGINRVGGSSSNITFTQHRSM